MSTVISVENISKAYRLGLIGGGTLKEDFARWCAKLRGKPDPFLKIGEEHHARRMGETFWALENVSFEVKEGEVLGIIGRNGAGKSTLLKILSQVTSPTSGEIKIKGRIASLLEVGTGFHPELTGRENVFLNGAILGMTKVEIRKKFDEIVAFSGIEEFIDTPVKRYSSGMYVRLAFAVAAHLEPEILIVDEVLAVGDAEFQKKCLGKMQDVAGHGRTVLFVSHNMSAVQSLCKRCVLLKDGRVEIDGDTNALISSYLSLTNTVEIYKRQPKPGAKATIIFAKLTADALPTTASVSVELTVHATESTMCSLEIIFLYGSGVPIGIGAIGLTDRLKLVKLAPGENHFNCHVKLPTLAKGNYFAMVQIALPWVEIFDKIEGYLTFEVHRLGMETGQKPLEQSQGHGCLELEAMLLPPEKYLI
jgi:lipopolysaccharide transport system ATP-binding protein